MADEPFWAPAVAVVGLGDTGSEIVERIKTETSTEFYSISDNAEAEPVATDVADTDFCFLTGNLNEPGVTDQAETIVEVTDGHTTLFVEGSTDQTEVIVEETSFLIKYEPTGNNRELIAWTIADLFEAMMPPTVGDLGHGDITITTSNRVGKLYVESGDGVRHDLTPGIELDPDGVLYFVCSGDKLPRGQVDRQGIYIQEQYSDASRLLWDNRVHSRYQDRTHAKRIVTGETSAETREQLLRT